MAKLNLNTPLLDESGNEIKEGQTLAKALMPALTRRGSVDETDIFKYYSWGLKLSTDGFIEIDKADAKALKKIIIEDPNLFIITKVPIIELIDNLKFK